jgi:hypothetical protein
MQTPSKGTKFTTNQKSDKHDVSHILIIFDYFPIYLDDEHGAT